MSYSAAKAAADKATKSAMHKKEADKMKKAQ
jgi:hypothetical protein